MSFDDLSSASEKLNHPTANRPKMPGRRLPAQFGGHSVRILKRSAQFGCLCMFAKESQLCYRQIVRYHFPYTVHKFELQQNSQI